MPASAVSAPPKRLFRRFRRANDGSAAVEFSLIAVPFFALLFAIIETGLVFFAGQVLETAIQDAGRKVYTHQLQDANLNATQAKSQFMTDLCGLASVLMTCSVSGGTGSVEVDVKYYPAGTTINITDPIDGSGNYDNSGFTFTLPAAGSTGTVVVRGFYQWPLYVTGLGYNIANINRNTSSSKRLLAATMAFHVEP
jgi:Flp pilus assembly protein TadG